MGAFVQLRKMIASHDELASKLAKLELHLKDHDDQIQAIFEAIQQLIAPPETKKKKIGFEVKEKGAGYGRRSPKRNRKNFLTRKNLFLSVSTIPAILFILLEYKLF